LSDQLGPAELAERIDWPAIDNGCALGHFAKAVGEKVRNLAPERRREASSSFAA
jgi:hypothetical protein